MIDVDETTVYEEAGVPLIVTEVVPARFVPVIVMVEPADDEVGVKLVIVGACAKAVFARTGAHKAADRGNIVSSFRQQATESAEKQQYSHKTGTPTESRRFAVQ